jgi:hypothetical protein
VGAAAAIVHITQQLQQQEQQILVAVVVEVEIRLAHLVARELLLFVIMALNEPPVAQ